MASAGAQRRWRFRRLHDLCVVEVELPRYEAASLLVQGGSARPLELHDGDRTALQAALQRFVNAELLGLGAE
jgi:hypothetical protein